MSITRRTFLKRTSLCISAAAAAPALINAATAAQKQNILFIAIDDLNDWIGCLGGHSQAMTPNIDRLARQGMLFTNAHCAVPVCGPSRGCVFTGRQPWNTGLFTNDNTALEQIGREFPTLMQTLIQSGYNTYGAGKLLHGSMKHYPDDLFTDFGPPYQKWLPFTDEETRYTDEEYNSPVDKSLLTHEVNRGPGKLNVTFPLNNMPRERRLGSRRIDSFDWGGLPVTDSEMGDYITSDWCIQQLKQPQDKPFFLGVGIYRPHIPLFVPQKYYDMYPPDKVQLPKVLENDLADLSPVARDLALQAYTAGSHQNVVEHGQWREAVSCYLACITFIDAQIGRVLEALEKSPYRDNTSIILWSDHGWHLGEKEHWGKFAGWEESTRVPLIIVPAKKEADQYATGKRCAKPVSLIDLYPTVLELTGRQADHPLDGKSLLPLLKNPDADFKDHIITTFGRGNHTIRTDRWRYIHYYDGSEELYDLEQDPNEFTNLADDVKFDAVKNFLAQKIPDYANVRHFVSMGTWKAVLRHDDSKTELFHFEDNKAVPEKENVAAAHPEIIRVMYDYIQKNNISEKYLSIPDGWFNKNRP
ncbi:sulfatase-like hydrolase/transferase [candidate division KSB1 bacterium]|nr:sulfatase-like hydrolase/transferase [candidate division KSB1 bacterium]